jgi:hypothetical protein
MFTSCRKENGGHHLVGRDYKTWNGNSAGHFGVVGVTSSFIVITELYAQIIAVLITSYIGSRFWEETTSNGSNDF